MTHIDEIRKKGTKQIALVLVGGFCKLLMPEDNKPCNYMQEKKLFYYKTMG